MNDKAHGVGEGMEHPETTKEQATHKCPPITRSSVNPPVTHRDAPRGPIPRRF